MGYEAITEHKGRRRARVVPSAENGAQQLFTLMAMNGWTESRTDTVARLVAGETLTHKGFAYSVRETGENQ